MDIFELNGDLAFSFTGSELLALAETEGKTETNGCIRMEKLYAHMRSLREEHEKKQKYIYE